MRQKLKECQGIRVQSYQHLDEYIEGDLVWYQPLNGNSWLGPAAVLAQRGQSVWVHTIRDIKKVAACKVKPFQLVDRESIKDSTSKKVMLEDGLENVKNLLDQEQDKDEDKEEDLQGDTVGVKYLRMVNTVSFSEMCNYTIPASCF